MFTRYTWELDISEDENKLLQDMKRIQDMRSNKDLKIMI